MFLDANGVQVTLLLSIQTGIAQPFTSQVFAQMADSDGLFEVASY